LEIIVSDTPKLPDFEEPPLIEVVHGIQFEPIGLSIVHPGQFYEVVAARYPKVDTRDPLLPVREAFGPAAMLQQSFRLEMASAAEMPRSWFLSADDAFIVQLQKDRLLLNWRFVERGASYPRYNGMRKEFNDLYGALEGFATNKQLGPVTPNQVEITYISHFSADGTAADGPDPAKYLSFFSRDHGPEWPIPMEALKLEARYPLLRKDGTSKGRLYVVLLPVEKGGRRLLQLELTARGAPETPDLDGVTNFLDFAHEQILNCFAGITTPAAHAAWRRR
jgi:uncharacterized protein (TIGR04255 family)